MITWPWTKLEAPRSLPCREWGAKEGEYTWEDWREKMRQKYPVRFFLQETLPMWYACNVSRHYKDAWYWIKSHTYKCRHLLDLRCKGYGYDYHYGWLDRCDGVLVASFQFLKDFVEQEKPFKTINWDADDGRKHAAAEIQVLYLWWTRDRLALYDANTAKFAALWKENNVYNSNCDAVLGEHRKLEAMDDEMLQRLINIRKYLWT